MFKRFCVLAKPLSLNVIAKNTNTTARTIYTIYLLICIFLYFLWIACCSSSSFISFFAAYSSCDLSIKNCYDVITDCHHSANSDEAKITAPPLSAKLSDNRYDLTLRTDINTCCRLIKHKNFRIGI